jgi:hypothetical protein
MGGFGHRVVEASAVLVARKDASRTATRHLVPTTTWRRVSPLHLAR